MWRTDGLSRRRMVLNTRRLWQCVVPSNLQLPGFLRKLFLLPGWNTYDWRFKLCYYFSWFVSETSLLLSYFLEFFIYGLSNTYYSKKNLKIHKFNWLIISCILNFISVYYRERCGGQGYLSCNRFGTFLGLAHAAMTAEGDNSVLMQKVAKERLGTLAKNPPKLEKPSSTNLKDTNYLVYLLKARELNLFNELGL